ncbi:MAG TPA: glutathione S-transferase family protein [Caulobacteraceae bacterium]|nr:glutathione S-transferase family protein [Caulobacteraceae bacterium]
MSDDLVFYTNPMSRGRIVRWMLEEVGRPYRTEVISYGPEMKSPAYLAINPMGKVPALVHGKTVVTEVAAICAYLADAFPEAGLAPPTAHRGDYYRWLFYTAGPLEQAWTNRSFAFELPEGGSGRAGYGSFEQVMDCLDGAVSGRDYVAGDRFSAADLYLAAQIGFGLRFGMFEKRPAFERYVGLHMSRPAAVRAAQIDEVESPAKT